MTLLFFAKHAAVLVALLAAAAGAGTLVAGTREPLPLRCALGAVIWGEALFALALCGWLRPAPMIAMFVVAIIGVRPARHAWLLVLALPAFLLALHPPLAFDETLYHLPFINAFAASARLQFLAGLRFPVFPQLHELLCVPAYLLAGDVATHLVSLIEVFVTTALIAVWARRYVTNAGLLAAALFAATPIVIHLATITYVDSTLTLFVAAGFYSLDVALTESRHRPLVHSALFLGAAGSVKYLGGFFAVSALLIVLAMRRRDALFFAAVTAAAALPTTLWLLATTGNPVFPFLGHSAWALPPDPPRAHRLLDALRVLWDITFARHRMNAQPPAFLGALVLIVAAASFRNVRARIITMMAAAYLAIFAFLPQDTRYLVPLLPLFCVGAAVIIAKRLPRMTTIATLLAVLPGIAYLAWRFHVMGLPPTNAQSREAELASRIAGYTALKRAGNARVYVCGGEQLQYYAGGELLGDFAGLHPYSRMLDDPAIADYFLVIKRTCSSSSREHLQLVYEDDGAQLWRVQPR